MTEPEQDLGPFYSDAGVTLRLGITSRTLDGLVDGHALLAIPGDDGSRLFPLFQFEERKGRMQVIGGLVSVMKALAATGADPMTIAAWLTAPAEGLDGESAIEHLRNGGSIKPVLDVVRADARVWGP